MMQNASRDSLEQAAARLTGFLGLVERLGNRLPDQTTIFLVFALGTLAASYLAAANGASVTDPLTHQSELVVNLLNADGLRWILANLVRNFVLFPPLGVVLVTMIAVGIAERTGLFAALLKIVVASVPANLATPAVIFAGTLSHMAADAGYVILPPLAAMLFHSLGRHPLAGIAAAVAGIAGGFSATPLLCTLDPLLAGLTQSAAQTIDAGYHVHAAVNYFFLLASVPMLVLVGWFVSDRIVEPRLGRWRADLLPPESDAPAMTPLTPVEKRGLLWATVVALAGGTIIVWMAAPRDGVLRDASQSETIRTFTPMFESLVSLLFFMFILPGLVYGVVTRQVRSDKDAARMMSQTIATMGGYIVVAFFAAQFIEWFKKSRLDYFIAISGADWLRDAGFTGVPLMLTFVFCIAIFNILISSASAKWTMLAPVFVPMLMLLGTSPATTQALYRVGDSCTNPITPLNAYLPVVLAAAHRYVPRAGLGTLIAMMVPYSIAFLIAWTALLFVWLGLQWPLGPGAPQFYTPAG